MLRVNDFFCGAGGMGLGFKYAGFRLSGAWDFDKYAVESYGNNVSPKVKQADITQMTWDEVPYADVWTFGFPCQDISVAGKQAGMVKGKTRSGLFYEIIRLLEETEINSHDRLPSVILAENVKAVNTHLPEIEKEYETRGYKMYATLYNSKYWGVPQNRERYFIMGIRKDIEKEFNFPQQQTEHIPKLSTILETDVGDEFFISKGADVLEIVKKAVGKTRPNDEIAIKVLPNKNIRPHRTDPRKSGISEMQVVFMDNVAPTCISSQVTKVYGGLIDGVRNLTPREYARLQGFPDTYKQVVSNRQFYKQMGNAVTVNVSQAIAERISDFLTD